MKAVLILLALLGVVVLTSAQESKSPAAPVPADAAPKETLKGAESAFPLYPYYPYYSYSYAYPYYRPYYYSYYKPYYHF